MISPWRWPDTGRNTLMGTLWIKYIINTEVHWLVTYTFWMQYLTSDLLCPRMKIIWNQGGWSKQNRMATISSFITGIEVTELRMLRWTEPVTSMRAILSSYNISRTPWIEETKEHRLVRKDKAKRSETRSVGGFGWINIFKPAGYTMQTFNNCTLCPHCIYVFCIYLRINSDLCHAINWLVFITEMESVYSAVRTGSLNEAVCASSVKG